MKKDKYINQKKHSNFLLYSTSFGIVFLLLWIFFYSASYAPFGENSMACSDADIQYLDFFAYLKDVLVGKNEIGYTFSKELGGTNIGTYSYYLASPLNWLVLFFPKTELHTFLNLLVSLKLGLSASFFAYFLRNRFSDGLRVHYIVCLSVAYALMQYNIAQASNIMWLDGVYILPLILLGVYRLVSKNNICLLSVSVGFAIIFSWYSAGIDCLFAIVWFFFELFFNEETGLNLRKTIRGFLGKLIRFGSSMLLGVILSAGLFLPTIMAMRDSSEGTFDWTLIRNEFIGDPVSTIQNYTLGATSSQGSAALFCGCFALIGCICFFFSKKEAFKRKLTGGGMLTISVLIFYWKPFVVLFSLFKSVESYWYRYSYVSIFFIIFLAACFLEKAGKEEKREISHLPLKCALGFSALLCILNYLNPLWGKKYVYVTVCLLILISLLLEWDFLSKWEGKRFILKSSYVLATIVFLDMFLNVIVLTKNYRSSDSERFKQYTSEMSEQIKKIQDYDSGYYRISQTSTRNMGETGLTAYYNNAVAYNYMSNTEYTSAPDGRQTDFLDRLGYRCEGANMQIVNTSIVGADALLSVKYVLSAYPINGLEPVEELGVYNGKTVYQNPYCLPMAFTYQSSDAMEEEYQNPFEYQNQLYSSLIGKETELYEKVAYDRKQKDNTVTYTLEIPEGNFALYGNLPWNSTMNASICIDDSSFSYAVWLSPSVFYIPFDSEKEEQTVVLTAENLDLKEEQFYVLDLDELKRISEILAQGEVENLTLENGAVSCSVEADGDETLFLSVPYHSGWNIQVNGEKIEPKLFGDCLISIPLKSGGNEIEMVYHVPMLKVGILVSIFGIIILVAPAGYQRVKHVVKNRQEDKSEKHEVD